MCPDTKIDTASELNRMLIAVHPTFMTVQTIETTQQTLNRYLLTCFIT
jgi:hypothetical protein